jgi:hypothetical protein
MVLSRVPIAAALLQTHVICDMEVVGGVVGDVQVEGNWFFYCLEHVLGKTALVD